MGAFLDIAVVVALLSVVVVLAVVVIVVVVVALGERMKLRFTLSRTSFNLIPLASVLGESKPVVGTRQQIIVQQLLQYLKKLLHLHPTMIIIKMMLITTTTTTAALSPRRLRQHWNQKVY